MESKLWYKQTNLKNRNGPTDKENRLFVASGVGGGGGLGVWNGSLGLANANKVYIGWINNKVLLYSTGNYIQYPIIKHNGKEYDRECIYIYIYICMHNCITLLCSRN